MANNRTALYAWHTANNARMVPFGGWDMPVQYMGIIEEHKAVRTAAGLFDISHMARLSFEGSGTQALLEKVFTNSVGTMKDGQVRYGLVCNEAGFILDDILVYRFGDDFAAVVNAGNREKIVAWLRQQATGTDVVVEDQTFDTTMMAVQGPKALAVCEELFPQAGQLRYYFAKQTSYQGQACILSRTGYTGEDGFELSVPNAVGEPMWAEFIKRGVVPCGLGARDTLRLEAAMPLYGHELSEQINPLSAGLAWAVKFNKGDFIGREALLDHSVDQPVRIGLVLDGKRAAREGSPILADGTAVGTVTSGSYVPHLEQSIAMGYVPMQHSAVGTSLAVDLRGTSIPATVVALPFYKRAS